MPWRLGPPDSRYMLRDPRTPDAPPSHIIVLATLGAPQRRRLARRHREAAPEPDATPVATTRATVIDVGRPAESEDASRSWLQSAGEGEIEAALEVLNRALHAFRVVTADPYLHPVGRMQVIVARLGYGLGEQVADGRWTAARELEAREPRRSRSRVLHPQARLAAVRGAREAVLVCEDLALRARLDLAHGRPREAALQLVVALDAALAELAAEGTRGRVDRLAALREARDAVGATAQTALGGPLTAAQIETVTSTLDRIESALRARAVANA
ncbi:MAG: hypothetical protein M3022_12940 [Actinomycetota bacterium]|nr:hypothetical protein [Actinomycetota bacterium]